MINHRTLGINERYAAVISKNYEEMPHPGLSLTSQQFVEQFALRAHTERCEDRTDRTDQQCSEGQAYATAADRWILDETHYYLKDITNFKWENNQFAGLTTQLYDLVKNVILLAATHRAISFFTKNPSAIDRKGDPENLREPLRKWIPE